MHMLLLVCDWKYEHYAQQLLSKLINHYLIQTSVMWCVY